MTVGGAGPSLVVLAAGASSRFGRPKQLEPLGPEGQALLDYALGDAARAGFGDAVLVIAGEARGVFEEHFRRFPPPLPIRYAAQRRADLPGEPDIPVGRTRPWGTAHAVWTVRDHVHAPFAVVNADDFYGAPAYAAAAELLAGLDPAEARYGLIGYRLDQTLSAAGGVSRAVCRTDEHGRLLDLNEILDVRRSDDAIHGVDTTGTARTFAGHETVSMNFWVFTPRLFMALETHLRDFLEHRAGDRGSELHLPTVLGAEAASGRARVDVVRTESDPFGITFEGDRHDVVRRLASLSDAGRRSSNHERARTCS